MNAELFILIGKNRPLPINGVDLSKDNETIQFSVNDINNLIQDINLDDFLFFRFVCYEDLSGLSIIAVIMEKNSRVIKKYLRTDPTAMLAYYQFRKYLLKDSFSDDCDGIAHKVSDY